MSKNNPPPYLTFDKSKGVWRLKLINGARKSLGKNKAKAFKLANNYNAIMRNPAVINPIEQVILDSEKPRQFKKTKESFCHFIDPLIDRIINERNYADSVVEAYRHKARDAKAWFVMPVSELSHSVITEYLNRFNQSAFVYNKHLEFISRVLDYAMDQGLIPENYATRKIRRVEPKSQKQRINRDELKKILSIAPLWMRTAMLLAYQTGHSVREIATIEYKLSKPHPERNGCVWLSEPETVNGITIFGHLYINRKKNKNTSASRVRIPIGQALKKIIDDSRDKALCPFVVHRVPIRNKAQAEGHTHRFQVTDKHISRTFSKLRDEAGIQAGFAKVNRCTFHSIRALTAKTLERMNYDDLVARLAHSDQRATNVYLAGHGIEWNEVEPVELPLLV